MRFPGDEWKEEVSLCPTTADIRKYHATGARLLLHEPSFFSKPIEITISDFTNDGELFKAATDDRYDKDRWYKTKDVQIIAVLPDKRYVPPVEDSTPTSPRRFSWRDKLQHIKWTLRQ